MRRNGQREQTTAFYIEILKKCLTRLFQLQAEFFEILHGQKFVIIVELLKEYIFILNEFNKFTTF